MSIEAVTKCKVGHFSSSLEGLRSRAESALLAKGFPSRRDEDWRYAPLTAFKEANPHRILSGQKISLEKAHDRWKLFLPIGATELSVSPDSLSDFSLRLASADDAFVFPVRDQGFSALLNQAISGTVLVLEVSKNQKVGMPIEIHYHAPEADQYLMGAVRLIVLMKEGAQATLVENVHFGQRGFLSLVLRADLSANSRLSLVQSFSSVQDGQVVHHLDAELGRGASLRSWALSTGGGLHRFEGKASLVSEGAEADLRALTTLGGREVTDYQLAAEHRAPHTVSRQLFKCILADGSRGIFNGKIGIQKGCHHVDSEQLNKALLLSDKAEIDTKPQLDVWNDDVKAGHGAAVGRLDPEELFYLQSRGIGPEQAVPILLNAFVDDVLMSLPEEASVQEVKARFRQKLSAMRAEELARAD